MRHYEIVLLVDPNQSTQIPAMIERYKKIIEKDNGVLHLQEDWGRKILEYPIKKSMKAHFIMLRVECDQEALDGLEYAFRYNDAVLRKLVIRREMAITSTSHMMKPEAEKESRGGYHQSSTDDYSNSDIG